MAEMRRKGRALDKELWIIGWLKQKKIRSLFNSERRTKQKFVFLVNMRLISNASLHFPFLWCLLFWLCSLPKAIAIHFHLPCWTKAVIKFSVVFQKKTCVRECQWEDLFNIVCAGQINETSIDFELAVSHPASGGPSLWLTQISHCATSASERIFEYSWRVSS